MPQRGSRSVSVVVGSLRCAWHRNAFVLVWTPVLLLGPLLDLHGSAATKAFQLFLIFVIAAAALIAAVRGEVTERDPGAYVALSILVAATLAGATHGSSQWLPTWILLANAVPAVIRGRRLVVVVPVVALVSMWAAWAVHPHEASRMWSEGFVVLLAGVASSAFTTLLDTIGELRRTREELARVAVAEERERFSRDLHDLLGHTLSVMVVKAQAVRRLAGRDPEAAAGHAADIEQIGRRALVDVRQAVDAMRAPRLAEELEGARRALDAAGISATVDRSGGPVPDTADQVLAWVVREGTTNVLRHSGAGSCRIAVARHDGRIELSIADDGVGTPTTPDPREGGLDGLRDRLVSVGGRLEVACAEGGFRLVATLPEGSS